MNGNDSTIAHGLKRTVFDTLNLYFISILWLVFFVSDNKAFS
ncbi:MAG: hypothetical protein ACSLEY_03145 [Candidatus Saccharimonadales bacterium]